MLLLPDFYNLKLVQRVGHDGFLISYYRTIQRLELQGVQAYSNIAKPQGLHTLPTAIVDYRGVRLSAQGLAPGSEGSDQDQEASPASRQPLQAH